MKIAILYSGRILNYDTYYNNLKKYIIKDNDVDFFLSHSKELNEDLTGFINLYKPKIVIDENIVYNSPTRNHSGMCMFNNRYRLFQSFKTYCQDNSINYDLIMVYRIDLLALSEIYFTDFINVIDNDTICIPNLRHSQGINDFIAIGNIHAIEKYCNLFTQYSDLIFKSCNSDSNELILKMYLQSMSIKMFFFPYNCLLRESIWQNGGRTIRISNEEIKKLIEN